MIKTVGDHLETLYEKGKRKRIVNIEDTAFVQEAAVIMHRERINLLAVIRNGNYVGVVSSSDTSGEFGASSSLRPSERMVSDVMTKDVVMVGVDDDLMDLPNVVTLHKIRHVIVINNEKAWIAVLSSNEILQGVMENIAEEEHFQAVLNAEHRRLD